MPIGATLGAAAIGGLGSIAGGMIQSNAATNAANMQQQQAEKTRNDLLPFMQAGQGATNQLTAALPTLTAPITMNQQTLEQTPGYQFNLQQGLKSVQSSAAARGLGTSGAALKGAANYATGLADSTYQNQFNNANTNMTNAYNRLLGVSNLDETAAAGSGQIGAGLTQGAAQSTTSAGTALSAGIQGAGNALTNGANNYLGYQLGQQALAANQNGGMYGNPLTGYTPSYGDPWAGMR